jgi:hypothetical protein
MKADNVFLISDFRPRSKNRERKKRMKAEELKPKPKLLTVAETAAMLRQSTRTITAWANAYEESGRKEGIHGIRMGKKWLFSEADVLAVMSTGVKLESKKFDDKSAKIA